MYNASAWKLDLATEGYPLGLINSPEKEHLQAILNYVSNFHKELYASHWEIGRDLRRRMAVIAGVGVKTLFRLTYEQGFLGLWEDMHKVTDSVKNNPHRQGDGRVPLASAELEDVGDIRYVKGVHGDLPMIPAVYEDVLRWLSEEEMRLPQTSSQALSTHLGVTEYPQLSRSLSHEPITGEIDLWRSDTFDSEHFAEMKVRLSRGELPEFIKVKIM
jgi:hypothetical protein